MKTVPKDATAEEIFEFCQEWVGLLASEDYKAASASLYQELNPWPPEAIRKAIASFGDLADQAEAVQSFRVTKFSDARGENPRSSLVVPFELPSMRRHLHPSWPIEIVWIDPEIVVDGIIGTVRIDYAINGEWSDLSSNFDLVIVGEEVAFSLGRIDVF